ncbi:hypothetical protein P168DRAFT_316795 [Aspergillus campestris IBT 28561]|uniref:Uncharacterized protein n=1 Tax=Aspergillus campestris (strain IBT 28561) TaxID=1392248 RepID=A0A2I1DAC7_ASPC2|nr:uncharacterized protein P168DRAFT_316795 [Aspergillus campestris IBT 28561]PKY06819.1 hypothetical protein P168DRAFT_316795 [Aspergillus campestris IBT 28561]
MANSFDVNQLPDHLDLPFPAATKQATGVINGVPTDVMSLSFSDKILFTISQKGRLGHWLHVPLGSQNPGTDGAHTIPESADDDSLLPMASLTATSLLGGRLPGHETIGQLYARQVASIIVTKNPNEKRLLVVGIGLETAEADRDVFFGITDLALQCI